MAFSQAQLDAVETAIASGELKVAFNGREVSYRSIDDLIKARDTIKASLSSASSTRTPRVSYGCITRR